MDNNELNNNYEYNNEEKKRLGRKVVDVFKAAGTYIADDIKKDYDLFTGKDVRNMWEYTPYEKKRLGIRALIKSLKMTFNTLEQKDLEARQEQEISNNQELTFKEKVENFAQRHHKLGYIMGVGLMFGAGFAINYNEIAAQYQQTVKMLNPEKQINITVQKEDHMQDISNIQNPVVEFDEQGRATIKEKAVEENEITDSEEFRAGLKEDVVKEEEFTQKELEERTQEELKKQEKADQEKSVEEVTNYGRE
jgi:hypothetical protein